MASLTQWTWVWVNSGSWWWTGKPGVLWYLGSQRVRHDWATELNWDFSIHKESENMLYLCVGSVAQSYLILCDPIDCSLSGCSVQGIPQARILEWIAISSFAGSSLPRDWTCVSCISCIGKQIHYHWATWEVLFLTYSCYKLNESCCCWVASVVSNSVQPHRRQPTRLPHPWDSPGKNTRVGRDLPDPETESASPALAGRFFTISPTWETLYVSSRK